MASCLGLPYKVSALLLPVHLPPLQASVAARAAPAATSSTAATIAKNRTSLLTSIPSPHAVVYHSGHVTRAAYPPGRAGASPGKKLRLPQRPFYNWFSRRA